MGTFGHYGPSDTGSAWHGQPLNRKIAYGPSICYEDGTITKLTGWGKGNGTSDVGQRLFVYDDSAGSPNNLVVASSELVVLAAAAEGWKDFTTASTHVSAGLYHVGIHFGAGGDSWMHTYAAQTDAVIRQRINDTDTYSDGTAATYGSVTESHEAKGYYFATYTPDVVDTTAPTCSITSPSTGTIQSGTIAVNVIATDNINVKTVDLKAGGVIFQTINATLGQTSFSFTVNTNVFANGDVTLTATATDPQGNQGTSSGITITVNNSRIYLPELTGAHSPEYRLSKEKFGAMAATLDHGFSLNVLDYGAVPDGEVNPNTGTPTGTDNTTAFQAAADAAYALGCPTVIVPHAGLSKFVHGDGTPLDRGYRILGQVTLKRNVAFVGAGEGKTGANQGSGSSGAYATSTALQIPPSAAPTLLIENTSTSAFVLINANTFKNFNFLWPNQIKADHYKGGPNQSAPTVYPAGIEMQGHDMWVGNLTDYNSYIFIKRSGGSVHTHMFNIASSSHKSIIYDVSPIGEWEIEKVDYNEGVIYNSGFHSHAIGPILDLACAGPSFLSKVGMNCEWVNENPQIKVRVQSFGIQMSDIWLDTNAAYTAIRLEQDASQNGTNQAAAVCLLNNVHVTRGAANALDCYFPDGNQAGGSNICTVKAVNSMLGYGKMSLVGGANYQFSNCQIDEAGAGPGIYLDGTSTGGLGQRIELTGCEFAGTIENVAGNSFVKISGRGPTQRNSKLVGKYTGGLMVIEDNDDLRNFSLVVPAGTVIAIGANVLGHILVNPPNNIVSPNYSFTVIRARAFGGVLNDTWDARLMYAPNTVKPLLTLDTATTRTGDVTPFGYAEHDRSLETSSLNALMTPQVCMKEAVARYVLSTGGSNESSFQIRYNAAAGFTVADPGLHLDFTYCVI